MSQQASSYFVPQPSHWPIFGSAALLLMASGAAMWMNHVNAGPWFLISGFCILLVMLFGWFNTVISESESGSYSKQVDVSFRWSMSWFIFSEVMFFAAFFGALFYVRVLSVPDLAHGLSGEFIYNALKPDTYTGLWPSAGPGFKGEFTPMAAWGIPALNTGLLLSSGVTLTWAHWALMKSNRLQLILGLAATVLLGFIFLYFQVHEYSEAYGEFNLKLSTGIYGSTFFLLTGFHGFHVTIGATMLVVILIRCLKGHFNPDHHFAFEAVAWYWHFVDVVWLFLFVVVYWL